MARHEEAIVTELSIAEIVRDPQFQMRRKLDAGAVKRYSEQYKLDRDMPPVVVARVDETFLLVDGWHRLQALENLGRHQVQADVRHVTRTQALWMAAQANLTHGVPLKPTEMRQVFRAYVKAGNHRTPKRRYKSYRDISSDIGKPVGTIYNWMRKDFPQVAGKMSGGPGGRGGLEPAPKVSSQIASARDGMERLTTAFQATSDPEDRETIIREAEGIVSRMKETVGWEEDPF
ncbi:ParB N-terminal domain-containing protein [Aurantimonas coralicida]|uniref:ParB N-terminal domain-containing protein n=1 Tax=Aurantimonas coralicida TaxID=182270 RepID=UPI00046281D1|nr:ParB N-terminal domain-containing protein [Aurantimonas coralicida]